MQIRLKATAVAVAMLSVWGCGDRRQTLPPGPHMQLAAPPSGGGIVCDFRAINKLVQSYFGAAEAKVVKALVSQMQDAGAGSTAAQDRGFDAMTHIASNVDAGNADFTDASALTNGLLVCMFTSAADLPATFPEDFTIATTPTLHGAYAIRGGATDPLTAVVLSRPLDAPFSGVAPPSSSTWPGVLAGNPVPRRILVYGRPGSHPQTYDWRIVPRSTVFAPEVVVGVCVDPFAKATSLLHEEHFGLLPYVNVPFLDLSTCSPVASRPSAWPLQFARSLAGWGTAVLGPRPLSAGSALVVGGLGGSTGGIRSEFGDQQVDTVLLAFTVQPSDVQVGQVIRPAIVVRATDAVTGTPVPNVSVTLAAVDNNGVPALLGGTLTQVTNAAGLATFGDVTQVKTGAYVLTAVGSVGGRPAIAVAEVRSARFNVRP